MGLLVTEWDNRRELSNILLDTLNETNKPVSAKKLVKILKKKQINVPKKLINSILFSEAKRYVNYDRETFKYTLKVVKNTELNQIVNNTPNIKKDSNNKIVSEHSINTMISSSHRFEFSTENSTSPDFFNVKSSGSTIYIYLNNNHPFFSEMEKYLDSKKYPELCVFLELILGAWAMNEDITPNTRKQTAQDFRSDWGRVLRTIIRDGFFDKE